MSKKESPEREVAVLLTDMRQYSKLTSSMTAEQIRDFIVNYQKFLQKTVMKGGRGAEQFEPFAGDSSITTFEDRNGEDRKEKCKRALKAAIDIAIAVESRQVPYTRIGIFVGKIIEAQFENYTLRFGNSFAAANRLEGLCSYFETIILMDRNIALVQDEEQKYVVNIGKITPKNFTHPIHVYSVYKPGIHKCPSDINEERLMEFIRTKNEGIEHFVGNALKGIVPDFPLADDKLRQANRIFWEITGTTDMAALRILDYIHEHPYPPDTFDRQGMVIDEKQGLSMGIRLLRLSQHLFKALDEEFYHVLVENTSWDHYFRTEWRKRGERIIHIGDEPNGIYYLAKGEVRVEDGEGNVIAKLSDGDVFGEMAYYSKESRRNATVIADTDIVVRRISTEHFERSPLLHKIFEEIARRRKSPV